MYDCLFVCMNVYVLNVICKSSNHFFFIGLGSVPFKKFDVVSFRQLFVILWITTKVVNWEFGIVKRTLSSLVLLSIVPHFIAL